MKKLRYIVICAVLLSVVLSACGCGAYGANYCMCFDTAEDVWSYFDGRSQGDEDGKYASAWKFMELPEDERFVDADYFVLNMGCLRVFEGGRNFIAYKINVDGEYVTLIFFVEAAGDKFSYSFREDVHLEKRDDGNASDYLEECLHYFTTNPQYVVGYWENHIPMGMIKDFVSFESEETAREYFRSLISIETFRQDGYTGGYSPVWLLDDKRDVSDEEKEALALELAGVLFNHYVECGFFVEYAGEE